MKRHLPAVLVATVYLILTAGCSSDTDEDAPLPTVQTTVFRNGTNGYTGTEDLSLAVPANFFHDDHPAGHFPTDSENPYMEWGTEDTWGVGSILWHSMALQHGLADSVTLLRFGDVFGNGSHQIPYGSTIEMATLNMTAAVKGDPATMHRILVPWDESIRWDDFGAKPGPNWGTDMDSNITAKVPDYVESYSLNVKEDVTRWTNEHGGNLGWAFIAHGTQDVLTITDSKISKITNVRVKLKIKAKRRAEVVVTLRHGDYTALLINRPGRTPCNANYGVLVSDFDVTIDQNATEDIHNSDKKASPLVGTFAPDSVCLDLPICTPEGGGLCGQAANGAWVLTVEDEWADLGKTVHVEGWGLEIDDGVNPTETHSRADGFAVPNHNHGNVYDAKIWTSEAPEEKQRPALTVKYKPSLSFVSPGMAARTDSGRVTAMLRLPGKTVGKHAVNVHLKSDDPAIAAVISESVSFAKGDKSIPVELTIGKAGQVSIHADGGAHFGTTQLQVHVGDVPLTVQPDGVFMAAGSDATSLEVAVPAGSTAAGDVTLSIKSSDPSVAKLAGATKLVFKEGDALSQKVELVPGSAPGKAEITVEDSAGTLGKTVVPVHLSDGPSVELDMLVPPYLQLGDGAADVAADAMRIAWQTTTRRHNGPNADRFVISWREADTGSWKKVAAAAPEQMDSASKHRHVVTLPDLKAGKEYEYRIVKERNGVALAGATWQARFKARPNADFRFAAMGNSGTGHRGAHIVADLLKDKKVDMTALLGDFVYDKGEWEHYPSRAFLPYEKYADKSLLTYVFGNHDVLTGSGKAIAANFLAPTNGPSGVPTGANYAFDYGDARFYFVDSSLDGAYLPKVEPWLANLLKTSTRKWNIVLTHEPPLTLDPTGSDRQANELVRKHALAPAVAGGADLFLAGAVHSYQRYLPITAVPSAVGTVEHAKCAEGKGTTLVYPGSGSWARIPAKPVPNKLELPMVVYLPKIGLGLFHIDGNKLNVKFVADKNEVLDEVTLTKCTTTADCTCK